jgi:hypothetical protein
LRLLNQLCEGLAKANKEQVNQVLFYDFLNQDDTLLGLFVKFLQEKRANGEHFEGECKVVFAGAGKVGRFITINRGGNTVFPTTIFDAFVARENKKEAASSPDAMDVVGEEKLPRVLASIARRSCDTQTAVETQESHTQTRLTSCDGLDISPDYFSADKTSTTTSTNAMSTDETQSSETSTARKKRKSKGAKKSGTNTVTGGTYNNNQHKMTARKEESANRLLQMFRHGVHHNVLDDDT